MGKIPLRQQQKDGKMDSFISQISELTYVPEIFLAATALLAGLFVFHFLCDAAREKTVNGESTAHYRSRFVKAIYRD